MAGYAFNELKENMVKASGLNLNVSMKQAIEICSYVRGRSLAQAKSLLEESIQEIRPVPIKRFSNGVGHKPGMAAGRYYPKACTAILKVLASAESNAKNKGFNEQDLKVLHIAAQNAPKQPHHGRKRRSIFKAAHIEVVLAEVKGLNKESNTHAKESKAPRKRAEQKSEQHSHSEHKPKSESTQ